MVTYTTSEVAKKIGIHPNTVHLYEEWGYIKKPKRKPNNYRMFDDEHIKQLQFVRLALKSEVLQRGLREKAKHIIRLVGKQEYEQAQYATNEYIELIEEEQLAAEEAIMITESLMEKSNKKLAHISFTRKEMANTLRVTIDTLRNWELNGLLVVKRKDNGYRIYNEEDVQRLKIIRTLRNANYSLSAILRMLNALDKNDSVNVRDIIDTPCLDEDIISVCDQLITSLKKLEANANEMLNSIIKMKIMF